MADELKPVAWQCEYTTPKGRRQAYTNAEENSVRDFANSCGESYWPLYRRPAAPVSAPSGAVDSEAVDTEFLARLPGILRETPLATWRLACAWQTSQNTAVESVASPGAQASDADRKDAERYKFWASFPGWVKEEVDARIDAAIAAQKENGNG